MNSKFKKGLTVASATVLGLAIAGGFSATANATEQGSLSATFTVTGESAGATGGVSSVTPGDGTVRFGYGVDQPANNCRLDNSCAPGYPAWQADLVVTGLTAAGLSDAVDTAGGCVVTAHTADSVTCHYAFINNSHKSDGIVFKTSSVEGSHVVNFALNIYTPIFTEWYTWGPLTLKSGVTTPTTGNDVAFPQNLVGAGQLAPVPEKCGTTVWYQQDKYVGPRYAIDPVIADGVLTETNGVYEDHSIVKDYRFVKVTSAACETSTPTPTPTPTVTPAPTPTPEVPVKVQTDGGQLDTQSRSPFAVAMALVLLFGSAGAGVTLALKRERS
jgi:hypothetical protein